MLFIGVAASSAFNDARDMRLGPGRRRRSATTRSRTSSRRRSISATSDGRLEKITFGAVVRGAQGRRARRDAAARARLLPLARRRARPDRPLLRGRGDERGRPEGRPARRRLGGDDARQGRARAGRSSRATRSSPPPAASSRRRSRRSCSARRCAGSPTRYVADAAARDVPPHHLAAGDVDLARRDHRLPRRADRDVAGERDALRRRASAGYAARVAQDLGRGPRRATARRRTTPRRRPRRGPRRPARHPRRDRRGRAVVSAPLRRRADDERGARGATGSRELEARKEAKYREIRDAEMDFRTGKLSRGGLPRAGPPAARRGDGDPARDRRGDPRGAARARASLVP